MKLSGTVLVIIFFFICRSSYGQTPDIKVTPAQDSLTSSLGIKLPGNDITFKYDAFHSGFAGYTYADIQRIILIHTIPQIPDSSFGYYQELYLPPHTQGLFCDFEDHINRKRKLQIDFSIK